MKRSTITTAVGTAVVLLSLTATACGGGGDKEAADTAAGDSSTTTTEASTTTTAGKTSAAGEDIGIFCTNAPAYGFDRLDYVLPHTPEHGRELKAKMALVAASAPDEIAEQINTFRVTTDDYLDAMESGEINDDPMSVITWSKAYTSDELAATTAAQKEIAAYVAANC